MKVTVESGDLVVHRGSIARVGIWTPAHGRRFHRYMGKGRVVAPDGTVLAADDDWIPNVLMDEGEKDILDDYLKGGTITSKYLALVSAAPADETKTMTSPAYPESATPGAGGYNRQQILTSDWGADTLNSGDYQATAAEKTFGANTSGGAWTLAAVSLVTVATGTAGLYLAYVATATGTVANTASFKYTLTWKNQ